MIPLGALAPPVSLDTQFILNFDLARYRGRSNVLLAFYPLDFTPICSQEVPELEALADRFATEAATQVAVVSVDSRFSHANWGEKLGGISIPMLADFCPKGAVGQAYGAYLPTDELDDRATVIIDAAGVVRYAKSVTINGKRDIPGLLAEAKAVAATQTGLVAPYARMPLQRGERYTLYGTATCFQCRFVYTALTNLHLQNVVRVKVIDGNNALLAELQAITGQSAVPVLVCEWADGTRRTYTGSGDIIKYLARRFARMATGE